MTETITATLDSIRYQGAEKFVIGNFSQVIHGKHIDFSGLGGMLNPQMGLDYRLVGKWSDHKDYGKQFKFSNYQQIKPSDESGIFRYLVRAAKWVGPTTASYLLDIYGDQTLEVLRTDPEMVASEVKGITITKALDIQEALLENENLESILVELMGILTIPGLSKALPMLLIDEYASDAVGELKRNPYIITQFKNIGFMIADRLAMDVIKIKPNSEFRIKAAINYGLNQVLRETGSTWVDSNRFLKYAYELISVDVKKIEFILEGMIAVEEVIKNDKWITFFHIDKDESLIAEKILGMIK